MEVEKVPKDWNLSRVSLLNKGGFKSKKELNKQRYIQGSPAPLKTQAHTVMFFSLYSTKPNRRNIFVLYKHSLQASNARGSTTAGFPIWAGKKLLLEPPWILLTIIFPFGLIHSTHTFLFNKATLLYTTIFSRCLFFPSPYTTFSSAFHYFFMYTFFYFLLKQ